MAMINTDGVEREWRGGFFYDWFAGRWIEKWNVEDPTQIVPRRAIPRHVLLEALAEEIEKGNFEAKLYGALLARTLIGSNMMLMKQFGERIAKLTKEDVKKKSAA